MATIHREEGKILNFHVTKSVGAEQSPRSFFSFPCDSEKNPSQQMATMEITRRQTSGSESEQHLTHNEETTAVENARGSDSVIAMLELETDDEDLWLHDCFRLFVGVVMTAAEFGYDEDDHTCNKISFGHLLRLVCIAGWKFKSMTTCWADGNIKYSYVFTKRITISEAKEKDALMIQKKP